jgi:hypothetical protein
MNLSDCIIPPYIFNDLREYLFKIQLGGGYCVGCTINIGQYRKKEYLPAVIKYLQEKGFETSTYNDRYNETIISLNWSLNIPLYQTYTRTDLHAIREEYRQKSQDKWIQSFMTTVVKDILEDVKKGQLEKHIFPGEEILEENYPDIQKKLQNIFPDMKISIEYIGVPNNRKYILLDWSI